MSRKYKIVITSIEEVQTTERGDWEVIERVPWTDAEIDKNTVYESKSDFLDRAPLKEVLGYTPSRTVTKEVETELLRQTVEELDLAAVIKAVNGL